MQNKTNRQTIFFSKCSNYYLQHFRKKNSIRKIVFDIRSIKIRVFQSRCSKKNLWFKMANKQHGSLFFQPIRMVLFLVACEIGGNVKVSKFYFSRIIWWRDNKSKNKKRYSGSNKKTCLTTSFSETSSQWSQWTGNSTEQLRSVPENKNERKRSVVATKVISKGELWWRIERREKLAQNKEALGVLCVCVCFFLGILLRGELDRWTALERTGGEMPSSW